MENISAQAQEYQSTLPSFEGTGLNIPAEKKGLDKSFRLEIESGKTPREAAGTVVFEMENNIRTFATEYIERGLIYPHLIKRAMYQGRMRMVNSYNGLPVTERITRAERFGAVSDASEKIETEMTEAEPGTIGLYTSPPKWTGLHAEVNGKKVPIVYRDSQTLAWWIDEMGQLHGLTITSDMTVDQNIELLGKFGVKRETLEAKTENETISNIVREVVVLRPGKGHSMSIEDIALKILEVRGFGDIVSTGAKGEQEVHSAQDLLRDIRRRDELLRFDSNTEAQLETFKEFVLDNAETLDNDFTQNRVMDEVKRVILRITGQKLARERGFNPKGGDNFDAEMSYLLAWGGCNGGGYEEGSMIYGSFGTRMGYYENERTQRTEFINGEYFVILDNGERAKGLKCMLCGSVTICRSSCYICNSFLYQV